VIDVDCPSYSQLARLSAGWSSKRLAMAANEERTVQGQLIGTWTLVSMGVGEGADRIEPFGADPKGIMTMDGHRLVIIITRATLPKFAAGNREQGSPAENQAIVQGSIAYFGTYTFDEATSTLTAHIEGSTFPNFIGQDQKRRVIIDGNELTYVNPQPSGGGGTAKVLWRRVR